MINSRRRMHEFKVQGAITFKLTFIDRLIFKVSTLAYIIFMILGVMMALFLDVIAVPKHTHKELFSVVTRVGQESNLENLIDFAHFFINNILVCLFIWSGLFMAKKLYEHCNLFLSKCFVWSVFIGSLATNIYHTFDYIGTSSGISRSGKLLILMTLYGPHMVFEVFGYCLCISIFLIMGINQKFNFPSLRYIFLTCGVFIISAIIEGFITPLVVRTFWA